MRHVHARSRSLGIVTVALVLLSATGALGVTPTPVVTTRAIDWESTRAVGFLAYTQNSVRRPNHFDLRVKPDVGHRWRATTNRTSGAHPGIDIGNTYLGDALVWSKGRKDSWNLAFTDLATRDPIQVPDGINTRRAEREPSLSGDHLLFARGPRSGSPYANTVVLYDLATDTSQVLAHSDHGIVNAGWVSGDWAVWQKCPRSTCSIWRYQISTDTKLRMPADVPVVYSPTVTSDGTVFYVRSGNACGQHTKIVRVLSDGVTLQTVFSFRRGVDAVDLFAYPNLTATVDLYLSRVSCRTFDFDVYVLNGV